jgi:hypothetical protein
MNALAIVLCSLFAVCFCMFCRMENDAVVAQQLQSEDNIRKEQERIRQEMKDQVIK